MTPLKLPRRKALASNTISTPFLDTFSSIAIDLENSYDLKLMHDRLAEARNAEQRVYRGRPQISACIIQCGELLTRSASDMLGTVKVTISDEINMLER